MTKRWILLFVILITCLVFLAFDIAYKPIEVKYVTNTTKEVCVCGLDECSELIIDQKNTINNFSKQFNKAN